MLFCAGVVGQEPVLFDFTIEENIRMGRDGCTTEDIEKVRHMYFEGKTVSLRRARN
jgi:ABC-type multidrug transport system fused ATPase/permease subunit